MQISCARFFRRRRKTGILFHFRISSLIFHYERNVWKYLDSNFQNPAMNNKTTLGYFQAR